MHTNLHPAYGRPTCFQQKMKGFLLFLLFLPAWAGLQAQRPQYIITAALDTSSHTVTGTIDISYTNHTALPLDKLGIHLWPNAYSTKNTALVKQMLELGDMDLYHAKPDEMGGLSGLDFISTDRKLTLEYDLDNKDIGWIIPDIPLLPGSTIHISSPFALKVPVSFSRLGRTGTSYQITQWYPHLAVFDEKGWHTMPYLEQGEFFNDFADYIVTIQTPPGYTVAATGILTDNITGDKYTSWRYEAKQVIDFAWFASPGFRQEKYMVDVGSAQEVELNVYIDTLGNELWKRAGAYAQRALKFYSEWLGPYPYPQMSVVYAPLSRGGYMEYPMVAQISYTSDSTYLDIVIAHEIGHTWLYGILASDERTYPWMDEGLNTFIEGQYTDLYHPTYQERFLSASYEYASSMTQYDVLQHINQFQHTLQPPAADPQYQAGDQYMFSAYILPAQGLEMMMSIQGSDKMKQMFRNYFAEHRFTHVSPADLKQSFESACSCDLSWFFEGWIQHAHEVDYRIKKFDKTDREISIVNKADTAIPLKLNAYKDGQPVLENWIDGFSGEKIIKLNKKADEVRLYDGFGGVSTNWGSIVRPHAWIPHISLWPKIESYSAPSLSVTPFAGKNLADGIMPGIAFASGFVPQQHFKFVIAPMYGLESKQIRGHATLRYIGDLDRGAFDKFVLSLGIDDFGYNLDTHYLFRDHYFRWEPSVAIRSTPMCNGHLIQWLKYRYVHVDQYYGRGLDYEAFLYANEERTYGIHELLYQLRSDFILRPFEALANVQTGKGFLRLNLRYKQHFTGKDKRRGIWVQGYGGWLPVYDKPIANVAFTFNGISSSGFFSKDYMYDQWLGGRNAESGLFSQQVFEKDAGLKTLSTIGIGDKWMLGGGFSAALPFKWIHFYMDAALFPSSVTEKTAFSFSGGFSVVLVKDAFEVYFPFLESKDIRESLSYEVRELWYERISFQANLKLYNPVNVIDRLQLGY